MALCKNCHPVGPFSTQEIPVAVLLCCAVFLPQSRAVKETARRRRRSACYLLMSTLFALFVGCVAVPVAADAPARAHCSHWWCCSSTCCCCWWCCGLPYAQLFYLLVLVLLLVLLLLLKVRLLLMQQLFLQGACLSSCSASLAFFFPCCAGALLLHLTPKFSQTPTKNRQARCAPRY